MMSCENKQQQLQDYASQELTGERALELEKHLVSCVSCRRDLALYQQLARTLPEMPEPEIPADLAASVIANICPVRRRPAREPASATRIRRVLKYVGAMAFAVTLGAALWGWVARIMDFAETAIKRDLVVFTDAAKDLWYLLKLLVEVAGVLRPTVVNIWENVQLFGEPLVTYGPVLLLVYTGVLSLGAFLCWRALSYRGERGLRHVS